MKKKRYLLCEGREGRHIIIVFSLLFICDKKKNACEKTRQHDQIKQSKSARVYAGGRDEGGYLLDQRAKPEDNE